ncbi:MAG: flagellar basal-body rod protein FlgF [Alphaproteobacteria bacterium]|nr:flagellar basal-body rod protein FlgF [Alphaproteobacteria bacterium]
MENAELIGLSRQTALRRQMDVVANNLANISTSGYKAERSLFSEYVMPVAEASTFRMEDRDLSYVWDRGTMTDFASGSVKLTGNPLDVALSEDAFFVIETEAGLRYTRNGAFQINPEGFLTNSEGMPVQGEGGPISFNNAETDISIAADGTISSSAGVKDKLQAVTFDSPQLLSREGNSLFSGEGANPVQAAFTQGALEGSNIKGVIEITEMIQVSRAYQSLANMLKRIDDLRQGAVQKLGSVQA